MQQSMQVMLDMLTLAQLKENRLRQTLCSQANLQALAEKAHKNPQMMIKILCGNLNPERDGKLIQFLNKYLRGGRCMAAEQADAIIQKQKMYQNFVDLNLENLLGNDSYYDQQMRDALGLDCDELSDLRIIYDSIKRLGLPKVEHILNRQMKQKVASLKQEQLTIQIIVSELDLGYKVNDVAISDLLQKFARRQIQKENILVEQNKTRKKLFSGLVKVSNNSAGYYQFDPFFQTVEFILVLPREQKSKTRVLVSNGDLVKVEIKSGQGQNRTAEPLAPQDSIDQLVRQFCSLYDDKNTKKKVIEFVERSKCRKIEDLFQWKKEDFLNQKVPIMIVLNLMKLINRVRFADFRKANQGCLREGTTHKVFRYLVYSVHGEQQLQKVPWISKSALDKAFQIAKQKICNSEVHQKLRTAFDAFIINEKEKFPYGFVYYGPPGTGKTVLTEVYPELLGFHLIEKGLSASDFSKSLVGQSKTMIFDLCSRAKLSPHLICSVAIDEVDGLVPDRKDKDQKNKGEATSQLLSLVGGNKAIENLVFMTSTNFINKIDTAIRRRFNLQLIVGRPNPNERTRIIKGYLKQKIDLSDQQMKRLVYLTTNFTGAALQNLCDQMWIRIKRQQTLSDKFFVQQAKNAAQKYSLKLGATTLPEIISNRQSLSQGFFKRLQCKFSIINFDYLSHKYILNYAIGYLNYNAQKNEKKINYLPEKIELEGEQIKLHLDILRQLNSQSMTVYQVKISDLDKRVNQAMRKKAFQLMYIMVSQSSRTFYQLLKNLNQRLRNGHVLVIQLRYQSIEDNLRILGWEEKTKLDYTGRMFVELGRQNRCMEFELRKLNPTDSNVAYRPLLTSGLAGHITQVIPETVSFFIRENVSLVLLIGQQLMWDNNAQTEDKMLEVLEEKMGEATGYQHAAVIIDADSLINLSASTSSSSMGPSDSFSVSNQGMFTNVCDYLKEYACIKGDRRRWICVVSSNRHLIEQFKLRMDWPLSPEEAEEKRLDEESNKPRTCARCFASFTNKSNADRMECMVHPGFLVDVKIMSQTTQTVEEIRIQLAKNKYKGGKDEGPDRYLYICCQRNFESEGELRFRHVQSIKEDDQVTQHRLQLSSKYQDRLASWR